MSLRTRLIAGAIIGLACAGRMALAQTDGSGTAVFTAPAESFGGTVLTIGPDRILDLLRRGDVSMWGLVGCSIITITFVLERLIVLRSSRVIPRTFVERFMDRLRSDELDRPKALELCRDNGSPVANVFTLVVQNWGRPSTEIRQAVADGAEAELFHLRRRVRALNGMATIGPLLGLLGTVMGMIEAFHALSMQTGSGKTELLASGISLALVATASGLAVAIVAAGAYYFLLGRVDRLVQEMDVLATEVVRYVSAEARADQAAPPRPRVVPARDQASASM